MSAPDQSWIPRHEISDSPSGVPERVRLTSHVRPRAEPARQHELAILDALPAGIVLIDQHGTVVAVNESWRQFIARGDRRPPGGGVGLRHTQLCELACGDDVAPARRMAEGVQSVLDGRCRQFAIEHPQRTSSEPRWLLMTVTRLSDDPADGAVLMYSDISERKLAQDTATRLAERLTTTLNTITDAILVLDADWRFTFANPEAERLTLRSASELLGQDIWSVFPEAAGSNFEHQYRKALANQQTVSFEEYFPPLQKWFAVRAYPSEHGLTIYFRDNTESKRSQLQLAEANRELQESQVRIRRLNRVYAVLSQINALIVRVTARDELFREACRVAVDVGGLSFACLAIRDTCGERIRPVASAGLTTLVDAAPPEVFESRPGSRSRLWQAIHNRAVQCTNDLENDHTALMRDELASVGVKSYAIIPLIVRGEPVGVFILCAQEVGFFDEEELRLLKELTGNIALAIEHLDKQERLDYLAYYDELTGLANRTLFLERVAQHMRSAAGRDWEVAVFVIDLERFKNINDTLGWQAGDQLLKQVADRLAFRGGDASLFARVGADRFAAVLPHLRPGGNRTRLLEKSMEDLRSHRFQLDHAVLQLAVKVGVATFPNDGNDAATLFQRAEAALKRAKSTGDRFLFYSSSMTESVAQNLTLENQLRQALEKEEFVLHYQPKVSLSSGKVTGAEALIRWHDPRTSLVPPARFIPILEETGLILEVGRWALRKAIDDYLRWRAQGLEGVRIAVNVSPLQLRDRGFIAELEQLLSVDPRAAEGVQLEITESMIMSDIKHGIASLQAIRAMGVAVALDDFGTGFSSLSYLTRLPIDTVKIDRSFIRDMTAMHEGLAIVSAIIDLSHSLKHNVVAEGVETEEQLRLLRLLGCDEFQGYHFERPVPSDLFETKYLAATAQPPLK